MMAVAVVCDDCGRDYRVRDEFVGREIRCKECGASIVVAEGDDEFLGDVPEVRSRRRKQRTRKSRTESGWRGFPVSVMTAIAAVAVLSVNSLVIVIVVIGHIRKIPVGDLLLVFLGVALLVGMIRGHRMAWQWGRMLAGLGGFIFTLLTLDAWFVDSEPFGGLSAGAAGLLFFVHAASMWTAFGALLFSSARGHFRLICPKCRQPTSKAADFYFNQAHCVKCNRVW